MSDLFQNHATKSGPVECLGQTFSSDEARRKHYLKLLAEKLKDAARLLEVRRQVVQRFNGAPLALIASHRLQPSFGGWATSTRIQE